MSNNTIDNTYSPISDITNEMNSILNSPALQQIQKTQEIINKTLNSPIIQQIELVRKALGVTTNTAALQIMEEQARIADFNDTLKKFNIFASIDSLRKGFPTSFSYEHNDSKFYNKEVYAKLFKEGNNWSAKIENNTQSVTYQNGNLEISGTETREVVAIKQLFPELQDSEIVNFITYLRKFPFLALSDEKETGNRIFKALKEKAVNHTSEIPIGTVVYRARELNNKKITYFSEEEMLEPDTGIPNIGRFNPYGVPLLYVSEDAETAKKELGKRKYQIAEIKINKPLHILDLEKSGGLLYKYCNLPKTSKTYNPEEYMLSNFLGQCGCYLKLYCNVDLDGFKYESTKNNGKYCYVLFEVHKPNIMINVCYDKTKN